MIISRLHIRRFRKLVDQVLECRPGLNVIYGRNDAGKSTLHLAFSAALYPVKPSEARSYETWGDEEPGEIVLEFEAQGWSYRLHKDFRCRTVALQRGDQSWDHPREVEQRIGEMLGLTSLNLFRATAHIKQWDLAGIQEEKREIGTRLARIMSGGDRDAVRVLSDIDEKIRSLEVGLRHPSKTPGPIKRDQDRIASLSADRDRCAAEVQAIERAAAERDQLGQQLAALEQQVGDDEELLNANRRRLELEGQWTRLTAREAELRSLLDRIARATLEADAADRDDAIGRAPPDAQAIARLLEADARTRLLAAPPDAPSPPEAACLGSGDRPRLAAWHGHRHLGWGGLAIAAVTAAALAAALAAQGSVRWAAGVLAGAAVLAVSAAAARARAGKAEGKARAEARLREERARQMEEQRREAAAEVDRQWRELGVSSVPAALDLIAHRERVRDRRAASRKLLTQLLGDRSQEAIAEAHREALRDLTMVGAERKDPDLLLRQLDAEGYQRFQTEAEERRRRLVSLQEAAQRLDGRLGGRLPHEELARIEEELQETGDRLLRCRRYVEVLRLARGVLSEAYRRTIMPGKSLLEERAGCYLRALSDGVYDRVTVDEHTLAPRIWVGPPKGWADVDAQTRELGSGAADQTYLGLRLALLDVLCGDRRPPLFLDDPFLAYDQARQAAALRLLRELSRDRQIFLLTCRSDYHGYADHVIELAAASAVGFPSPTTASSRGAGHAVSLGIGPIVLHHYMDLRPKGRDEADQQPGTQAWVRRHDEYQD